VWVGPLQLAKSMIFDREFSGVKRSARRSLAGSHPSISPELPPESGRGAVCVIERPGSESLFWRNFFPPPTSCSAAVRMGLVGAPSLSSFCCRSIGGLVSALRQNADHVPLAFNTKIPLPEITLFPLAAETKMIGVVWISLQVIGKPI